MEPSFHRLHLKQLQAILLQPQPPPHRWWKHTVVNQEQSFFLLENWRTPQRNACASGHIYSLSHPDMTRCEPCPPFSATPPPLHLEPGPRPGPRWDGRPREREMTMSRGMTRDPKRRMGGHTPGLPSAYRDRDSTKRGPKRRSSFLRRQD
jgi:hypothetical protein